MIILCKTLLKGGAEKQALILARLLTEQNYHIHLINWCGNKMDPDNMAIIKNSSIKYYGLNGNPLRKFIFLNRIVQQEKDFIIISYLTLANFIAGITGLMNRRVKVIGGIRTEKFPLCKYFVEKLVHNYLSTATVFNNFTAKEKFVRKGFKPEKIVVIHNAININTLELKEQTGERITIISVSRFVKSKDYETALASFSKLAEQNPGREMRYLIVGYGKQEAAIRNLIKQFNLGNIVDVLINPIGIRELLTRADIFLSTSLFEGLSNSIMEAMVAGLPVIATDVGDNRYLVQNSFNGFLVPCKNVDAIVEKMQYLIIYENARKKFGKNGYLKISSEFSEDKLLDSYHKLLSELTF